jgi:hypothetical protein
MNELIMCHVSVKVLPQKVCWCGQNLAHNFYNVSILTIINIVNDKYKINETE